MSSPETFDVVEQRLNAAWSETPVVFENDPFNLPNDPAHFVYVELWGDLFGQASIGAEPHRDNLWREEGAVYLHVMTRDNIGSREARRLARALADLFKGEDIGPVTFLDASIGAGEPAQTFGNYFAMTATVFWRRDE